MKEYDRFSLGSLIRHAFFISRSKKGDVKAFAKMMRMAGTSLLLKHGQAISEKGLDAIGLSSCAEVSRHKINRQEDSCWCSRSVLFSSVFPIIGEGVSPPI